MAPAWKFVDLDGTNGINKNAAKDALSPQLVVFNSKLYAIWSEADNGSTFEIRAAVYNGIDFAPAWTFVDGNSPTVGVNKNRAKDAAEPFLIEFNSQLYAAWEEVGTQFNRIRAAAYNGEDTSPAWHYPDTVAYNSKLYATWLEDSGPRAIQLRAVVNDGGDSWRFVDGDGMNGINHNPLQFVGPRL